MKLNFYFILVALVFQSSLGINNVYAKNADTVQMRVWYRYAQISDTLKKSGFEERMCLDIGKRISVYYSENSYKRDSIIKQQEKSGMPLVEILGKMALLPKFKVFDRVYKNYPKAQQLSYLGSVFVNEYLYHENMPIVQWKIVDEHQEILGYNVQKANASYAGRQYEAWFTTEIPISEGPWKFSGLPGLILKVKDSQNHFGFTAIGLQKISSDRIIPISLDKLKNKNKEKFFKVSRKVFLEAYKKFKLDPYSLLRSMDITSEDKHGRPIVNRAPRPFNLMEKY